MQRITESVIRFKLNPPLSNCLPVVSIFLVALLFIPIAGNALSGALSIVEITSVPPLGTPPTIEVGRSVVFTAVGKDAGGNTVPIPNPMWYSDGVHGTIAVDPDDPNKCTYTATTEGADYIQCSDGPAGAGGKHGSLDFTVVEASPSVPTSVVMTPETATITQGDSVEFTVTVFDQNDEEMPSEPVTFTAEGGTVTPDGVYTGNDVGEHTVTVKVTGNPTIDDTSIVTVDPVTSVPTSVVMTPETMTITQGDSVEFTVTVFDQNDDEMPDEPVTFTAEGGTVTTDGAYTGNDVGEHTVTVKVTSNPTIDDTSIVTVDPVTSVPTSVVMTPETMTITKGDSVTFTVTVFDQNNEEMPSEPVTFTAEGGTVTPDGVYTGNDVGEHTVTVKVTSNPTITDTSTVTVEADADGDGISNTEEDNGPNGGDGNGDGTPDSLQSNVSSTSSATGYLTIEVISGCQRLERIRTYTEESQGNDNDYDYPYGLVGFKLPCTCATLRVYYYGASDLSEYVYRRYGPTPPNFDTPTWDMLPEVIFGTVDIGGQTVAYAEFTLTDGQLGDDTDVDGVIYNRGGPSPSS